MSDSLPPHGLQHTRLPHPLLSQSWLELMSLKLLIPSNYLILCHPLLLLPSIFPSIRAFSNELALHIRWPKYWSFSFTISPFNEYSGLVCFRIDWFDLLAVQGILAIKYEIYFSSIYFPLLLPLVCKFHRWGVLPALFIFISWHEKILITCVRHSSTFAEWIRE